MEDKPLMIKGIISAVAAFTPVSIVGIILGIITNGGIKKYLAAGGEQTGKIKAASITSKVGIIAGIVMTIIYAIYWAMIILAAVAGAMN